MIEREIRFQIDDKIKKSIVSSSNLVEEESNYVDLCMGKYGFDSLDKLGYIIRIRNKSGNIFMESKRRMGDNSWSEAQVNLKNMKDGYDFLSNLGLKPYLFIKRKRGEREIEQAKIFIDQIDLLGTYVEFELKEGFSFSDLVDYIRKNGIKGKPAKLYGDIFKEKMKEPNFRVEFDSTLRNFLRAECKEENKEEEFIR